MTKVGNPTRLTARKDMKPAMLRSELLIVTRIVRRELDLALCRTLAEDGGVLGQLGPLVHPRILYWRRGAPWSLAWGPKMLGHPGPAAHDPSDGACPLFSLVVARVTVVPMRDWVQ